MNDTQRILQAMEKASDDPTKRREILAALRSGPLTAQQMFQLGRHFEACQDSDEEHLRKHWGNEGNGGWFGEIMDEVNRRFVQALEALGNEPTRRLRIDWIKQQGANFHIEVYSTAQGVTMRIVTPHPNDGSFFAEFLAK